MSQLALTINGEGRVVPGPATVQDLLARLGLDPRGIVVELNRRIVRRPEIGQTALQDGDVLELVHFVGGG
jgi:thiamine biosynthesis protein ThiS